MFHCGEQDYLLLELFADVAELSLRTNGGRIMAEATKLPVKTEERKAPGVAPWRPFESLRHEIDRLLEDFDGGMWRSRFGRPMFDLQPFWPRGSTWAAVPAVDIAETDKAYEITAELPGMDEKNIEVKFADGVLTIRGREKRREGRKEEGLLSQRAQLRLLSALVPGSRWRRYRQDRGDLQEGRSECRAAEERGGAKGSQGDRRESRLTDCRETNCGRNEKSGLCRQAQSGFCVPRVIAGQVTSAADDQPFDAIGR
jgi:HSP20 family protein